MSRKRIEIETVSKSVRLPKSDVDNFDFLYNPDVFTPFIKRVINKAVKSRSFFEFCMFDDVEDFDSVRSLTMRHTNDLRKKESIIC